jgi:EmrB/QacA subfamily drug resistance transporter
MRIFHERSYMQNSNSNEFENPLSMRSLPRRQLTMTFIGLILAMFLSSLDQTVVGVAMPRVIADLMGFNQYTWVTTAYIITSAVTIPIIGKLVDMYGRKWFFIAGILGFLVGSLLCGLSQNMTQLVIFRGFQGIGAGTMMTTSMVIVADLFPPAERGKYMGYMTGIFALSSIVGPTLGGFFTDALSWRWVFFINIPLGMAVIFFLFRFFPNLKPDSRKHNIDLVGVSVMILCVVPLLLALTWGGTTYPWGSVQILAMLIMAAFMAGLFVLIESRAKEPLIPLSLFKNNIVTVSIIVTFLTSIGMFGAITFIPLFFQGILGASPTASGNLMIPMIAGVLVGNLLAGQLMSRGGGHYKILGISGTAAVCVGLFLFSRMTVNTSFPSVTGFMVITGMGLGATMPVFTVGVQNAVPLQEVGTATSAATFFRSIGGSVGLAILGSVMNNRFAAGLVSLMPDPVKEAVPPETLASLSNNPQALVSPDAQAQLRTMFNQASGGDASLFELFLGGVRQALAASLSEVFLIGLVIVLIGLVACFFLREIPLKKSTPVMEPVSEKRPADKPDPF